MMLPIKPQATSEMIATSCNRGIIVAFSCVLALVSFGYFRRFSEFGFYGDDAAFFGGVINRSWGAEWQNLWFCLTRWPQGRPLGMGLNLGLLPHAAFSFGGLEMLHVLAFGIVAANTLLMFRLIARFASPFAAFIAAAFYGLAPADTAQISLVWALNSEVAVLIALCTAHAALSRRWILYGLGVATVLTMAEPAAMFALVVPVCLAIRIPRLEWRRVLWPAVVWIAVVALVLFIRKQIGDPWGQERVGEITANPAQTLVRSLQSATTGPLTHFRLVFSRLVLPLSELCGVLAVVMIVAAAIAVGGIKSLAGAGRATGPTERFGVFPRRLYAPAWLTCVGLLGMCAIYATFFRSPWHPAHWATGFMSGVHLVAACGGALVFAGLFWIGEVLCPWKWRILPIALASGFLAALVGFGQLVQKDYAAAWQFQREFWRAYEELCPDAGPGTYTLVLDRNLPDLRFIERNSWTAEVLPDGLFRRETNALANTDPTVLHFQHPPSVIFTAPNPEQAITIEGGVARWKPTYYFMLPKSINEQPVSGHVIILERRDTRWLRWTGSVAVDGGIIELQSQAANIPPVRHRTPLASVFGL